VAINPSAIRYLPTNVEARIKPTTIFGSKYVELVYPPDPSPQRLKAGSVVTASNISTEVNTAFENLTAVVRQVDPQKLNAVLTTLADALRGKGERIGEATVDLATVLETLNTRLPAIQQDFRSLSGVAHTYAAAAPDLIDTLSALSTTSATVTRHQADLDTTLLATIGLGQSGTNLLDPIRDTFVKAFNDLRPTTQLLLKYNPMLTCTLVGAAYVVSPEGLNGGGPIGGNGYSAILDVGLGFSQDLYKYPENLPIVAAKGGPDGKPGCGGLPYGHQNFPIRALVTNTGYGTGMDWRPNPGIAHPWFENFFPVTRAVPEDPHVTGEGPPAIGPVPYPGAPPYGAPLFGPDGAPLWAPPPPGAPPPPVPGVPVPPPPYGPGVPVSPAPIPQPPQEPQP
jgi:phospholipid/cholesterol/gamma-HCH transport system substrate-binding protein